MYISIHLTLRMSSVGSSILKVGVTGGIGSGKTTVCRVFEKLGIPVYYADAAAAGIVNSDFALILEIKSVENLAPVHYSQLLTYLKLSDKRLGLLINFNSKLIKDSIHRIVNNL